MRILDLFSTKKSCRLIVNLEGGEMVLPLEALTPKSFSDAGGKATRLALLGNVLALPLPPGFVITACAFGRFLEENGLTQAIEEILAGLSLRPKT